MIFRRYFGTRDGRIGGLQSGTIPENDFGLLDEEPQDR